MLGSVSTDPGGAHDETSSSAGNGKEDEDAMGSDDESDDRLDPQQHDPERLKAFNVSCEIIVDSLLDLYMYLFIEICCDVVDVRTLVRR